MFHKHHNKIICVLLHHNDDFSLILGSTAFHSLELGFRTIMIDDCSRGIDHGDIARTFERIREQNGLVVQSNEVYSPISCLNHCL